MASRSRRYRAGHRDSTLVQGGRTNSAPGAPTPFPAAIVDRFSDALCALTVVHHSLSAREIGGVGDEEVVLRQTLDVLKSIYSDLDLWSGQLARADGGSA